MKFHLIHLARRKQESTICENKMPGAVFVLPTAVAIVPFIAIKEETYVKALTSLTKSELVITFYRIIMCNKKILSTYCELWDDFHLIPYTLLQESRRETTCKK